MGRGVIRCYQMLSNAIRCTRMPSDVIRSTRMLSDVIRSGVLIEIDDNQAYKLRLLSIILGNEELYSKINELFPSDFSQKNLSQYINLIQCYYHFSQFSSVYNFSDIIDYISQNFYLIEEDTFLKIPRNLQYLIISNPHLQLKNEDSILDLIIQIIDNDKLSSEKVQKNDEKIESILFLEQVEFTGLTEEKLREFLRIFDFNEITHSLWTKLYECFFIHFHSNRERIKSNHSTKYTAEYIEGKTDKFDGIINYLTKKFGGNVDDVGVCKLTASSVDEFESEKYLPSNVADYQIDSSYFSSRETYRSNSWIKLDFVSRKVHPTHYSIKTWSLPQGNSHMKNWVFECSNSDKDDDWKILDSRKDQTCLDKSSAEYTFEIQNKLEDNEYKHDIQIY